MRFIDLEEIAPLIGDKIATLEEAKAEVSAEIDPVRRSALIDRYRGRWTTPWLLLVGL